MLNELNCSFSGKTLKDYEVISVLGSGSYGTCYKVRDKESDKLYAWKAIDYGELDESKLESLVSEITVLRHLQHPNIVQYYHHLNSHEAKSIFIIMEWCEGGDLSQLISCAQSTRKRFEEMYIWRVLFQLCKALQVCHSKLKQGTILHRDIKPANIFLDSNGNAKLGDFGLARILRRNQNFAQTIVGTPYYMSPEIFKGTGYDCRSDVWALGCLTYEMAALRPPFRGSKLHQLSTNISNGNYVEIPNVYSRDLQEIIKFMLIVSDRQRPCVEMVARHPQVVRNVVKLDSNIETLIDAEKDFLFEDSSTTRTQLRFNTSASILSSKDNSIYDDAFRLDISGVFTPDLRTDILRSANRKLFRSRAFQQSDSELYKSTHQYEDEITSHRVPLSSPRAITENIFNKFLEERLNAVRLRELLVQQKEDNLTALEKKLNEKECRLLELELKLDERHSSLENQLRKLKPPKPTRKDSSKIQSHSTRSSKRLSTISTNRLQSKSYDETYCYCSIEPQDILSPTVAKLNLAALPASKAFSTIRKVTFQSPKTIITYDTEESTSTAQNGPKLKSTSNKLRSSYSSSDSDGVVQRRKSLLSILGIKRFSKEIKENIPLDKEQELGMHQKLQSNSCKEIISRCEPEKLTNIWTKENKRAAFDMLAAMKASDSSKNINTYGVRQSMRDPARIGTRRDRMRQSLKV